jgi:serine/threonine protein kinase
MSYPTLEQYNEAFQYPQLALIEPELKKGVIATTGLGLPLALCGGFALTYTLNTGSTKYAVRCFHKHSNALETRYSSISRRLKTLNSPYFVDFEFQPQGVKVSGKSFPIVKMAWAAGTTLGEFLEQNYRSADILQELSASLRALAQYLESQNLAHGDIQPGNVMIANGGKSVRLIDYDGMFVEDLKSLGSAELGHRNFQHPQRASHTWDSTIDRFSFIGLNLALCALEAYPDLWPKTQSDGDSILFKANDYADPDRSMIFGELINRPRFSEEAKNFAAICKSPFEKIPSLEDFLAKRNIPQAVISVGLASASVPAQYISAYPVLDATNYMLCLRYVGDRVELIGRIVEIKQAKTRHGKPYVFINFGPWQGQIVKISIWSEGLAALGNKPDEGWVGKWVSVIGLMEPPYNRRGRGFSYTHLAISVTQSNQIHLITDSEAKYRLAGTSTRSAPALHPQSKNKEILDSIRGNTRPSTGNNTSKYATPVSQNQAILQQMRNAQGGIPSSGSSPVKSPSYTTNKHKTTAYKNSSNCFIATAIYGIDAPETHALRVWRDNSLLQSQIGRCAVFAYYKISPSLVPVLKRNLWLSKLVRSVLDRLVNLIQ